MRYSLGPSTAIGPDTRIYATTGDVTHTIAFNAAIPGRWTLHVSSTHGTCVVPFTILPLTDDAPGTLTTTVTPDEANATATITFQTARDGKALPHYEFDTRAFHRTPDGDTLVWSGKVHGHDGEATFTLGALVPGTYEIHTYPSAQEPGTAPVATDDPAGFVTTFSIGLAAPRDGTPATGVEQSPAPVTAFAALIGLALLLRRRR